MKKIYQYILLAVALVATASCSNDMDEALQPANNGNLQFVVSDFPAFGEEPQTRASTLGNQDPGKTAWEKDDEIFITLTSEKFGTQHAVLTYDGSVWKITAGELSYMLGETPEITALYAPCCEFENGAISLILGQDLGMSEYLEVPCVMEEGVLTVSFANVERTYSRLRIVGTANQPLTVTTTGFTPAGADEAGEHSYTLIAEKEGNVYLYGTFAENSVVTVKIEDTKRATHSFTTATEPGKSYALYAGEKVEVYLFEQTRTYTINGDGYYEFTGTGSHGIKVESGNPTIVLNNASITLTGDEGNYFGSPVNGIHIASTSGTTTIRVIGSNSITPQAGAGIFVAEGGTVKITGRSREDVLTVTGAEGSSGIGGYVFYNDNLLASNCGNITIDNVTVHAYGKKSVMDDYAPGIGSAGKATCGTVTINNAVVYAYGADSNYDYIGAAAIGSGFPYVGAPTSIPTVIVNNSSVHTYRSNPYSDYIGWAGDEYEMTNATGSINCGEGGSITNSTIYCYTGPNATTTDKVVTYDENGTATEQTAE